MGFKEKEMKKIVCPVDFSNAANNAVEYAANVAKHFAAKLILLHIAEDPILTTASGSNSKLRKTPTIQLLEEKMSKYRVAVEEDFQVECTTMVKDFTPTVENALGSEIENGDYDLIVMGTNGTRELSQVFLGTNTSGLIRKISRPLLIVPEDCAFEQWKNVVYASDYKTEDVEVLKSLVAMTKVNDPNFTVLHVSEKETEMSQEIFTSFQDLFEDKLNVSDLNFARVVNKNTAQGIDEYMRAKDADLLVLLTHRYSLFERLFHTSTAKNMSFVATYPVLISHGAVQVS